MSSGQSVLWGELTPVGGQQPINFNITTPLEESVTPGAIQGGYERVGLKQAARIVIRNWRMLAISSLGAGISISGAVLSVMSRQTLGVAVTWGMLALVGFAMPVLVLLRVCDLGVQVPAQSSSSNQDRL